MNVQDVGFGVRVRLSADGRARRLWAAYSDAEATIRDVTLVADIPCVRVSVDGERRARTRMMRLELLEVVS